MNDEGKPVVITDPSLTNRFGTGPFRMERAVLYNCGQAVRFRSAVSVPMLRDGHPIGAISVTGVEPAMFSERQIALLRTFAD
ncbi:MAG: GAF domain-containing protein, partial [Candidatus Aminicenantes bacterium]|nr:GAF domain-containing protein [Candidatus Aminicenantes bacterium]